MKAPRVFVDASLRPGHELTLPAAAHHHLARVLRLPVGAPVALFDGRGHEYLATLTSIARRGAVASIGQPIEPVAESPLMVSLVQSVARGDRMDYTLQKAVELGVTEIVPVITRRSSPLGQQARVAKRWSHWQGVIVAACEQCGRACVPELGPVQALESLLEGAIDDDTRAYVLDPNADRRLRAENVHQGPVRLMVGPEGGLDDSEIAAATRAGFRPLALGPRTLRTETAGVVALALLQGLWGDVG